MTEIPKPTNEGPADPPRRELLSWLAGGLLSLWAVGFAWVVGSFIRPPHTRQSLAQRTLRAGTLDSLPVGQARLVRNSTEPIYVVRSSEDKLVAVSAICTHLHCVLNFDDSSKRLLCPCHAASFDLNGNVLDGPAPRPLQRFEVDTQLGEILVQTHHRPGGEA